jgi:diadenosine tetraphosphate (Ap4A) HIT family hydrolase
MRRHHPYRASPVALTAEEWAATHELLAKAKAAQDERLAPDGYTLIWNCFPEIDQPSQHAHLHVIPRFDDEPLADRGGRSAIKVRENRRPDPSLRGSEHFAAQHAKAAGCEWLHVDFEAELAPSTSMRAAFARRTPG